MKSLIKTVAVALVVTAPVVSFAQSDQPLTRAQVRAELIQLEKAGYNPATSNDAEYPANIQAAEARAAAQDTIAQPGVTSVGGVAGGTSQSGGPTPADLKSLYFGGQSCRQDVHLVVPPLHAAPVSRRGRPSVATDKSARYATIAMQNPTNPTRRPSGVW